MPVRKWNSVIEREGANYVQAAVEANNCVYKEVNRQHDYGHDATVLLVEGEEVIPKEVALQIKSGASYCTESSCRIPATKSQLKFWAEHDLTTLGVVYDPAEPAAYWVDLQTECRKRTRGVREPTGGIVEFPKSAWNRFDARMFREFLVPTLQGKAPLVDLETCLAWARSSDFDTHEIGVRVLRIRHPHQRQTWDTMISVFCEREPSRLSPEVCISLVKVFGHHDDASPYGPCQVSESMRTNVRRKILQFGPGELAKVLYYVEGLDFERPSMGYTLLALLAARRDSPDILRAVRDDPANDEPVRKRAEVLVKMYNHDPQWWSLWGRHD